MGSVPFGGARTRQLLGPARETHIAGLDGGTGTIADRRSQRYPMGFPDKEAGIPFLRI